MAVGRGTVHALVSEYDVQPINRDAEAHSLSDGNPQKLIVGREFERSSTLVVASHPTPSVDIDETVIDVDSILLLGV